MYWERKDVSSRIIEQKNESAVKKSLFVWFEEDLPQLLEIKV